MSRNRKQDKVAFFIGARPSKMSFCRENDIVAFTFENNKRDREQLSVDFIDCQQEFSKRGKDTHYEKI